jgi:hypothetical protein
MKNYEILSFGGGVQSSALAILIAHKQVNVDAIVFVDTGFEKSNVFAFLEKYTLPMLEKAKIPFYIAKTEDYEKKRYADFSLPAFFTLHSKTHEITRSGMFCSDKWKRNVYQRFVNAQFGTKNTYTTFIGFSTDESSRAIRFSKMPREDLFEKSKPLAKTKWTYEFPLIELNMSRQDCIALVKSYFHVEPPKSSCIFCPNHKQDEWTHVKESADWEKVIAVDKIIRTYNSKNGIDTQYLTPELKPIDECVFSQKNEIFFERHCSNGCFL